MWAWYIQNITGPHRLARSKVDRIVANSPWVKMADIQAEKRKRDLQALAQRKDMDLWTGGKQAPHFDIGQLFIKRARQLVRFSSTLASRSVSLATMCCARISRQHGGMTSALMRGCAKLLKTFYIMDSRCRMCRG